MLALRCSLLLLVLLFSNTLHARSFTAEGSDLLMGVGAENIALAGAVVADADDVFASYWNPSGLSQLDGTEVALAKQLNAKLIPNNFFAIATDSSLLNGFGLKTGLAFAFIPRLHIRASGAFREEEFESIFIRYALPGLPSDFDGNVESKTKDYRFAWGIAPADDPRWRVGMAISYIECATAFCGVFAEDPGNYTIASVNATAWALHLSGKYHHSNNLSFGFNLKDLNTQLDIETIITDNAGTRNRHYQSNFPRDLSMGLAWRASAAVRVTSDLQLMVGEYGDRQIDFRIWRSGLSYQRGGWHYRGGVLVPLVLEGNGIEEFDLPAPLMPTFGFGWLAENIKVDAALYAHPLMSYQRNRFYPALDVSLSWTP